MCFSSMSQALQSNVGGSSKRSGVDKYDKHDHMHPSIPHNALDVRSRFDDEWEAKEELRFRELEEARGRAAQMEKTMRWWSDCTANWREKWSKVRSERNKAREEARSLKLRLESSLKDFTAAKREKHELESENVYLKGEIEKLQCTMKSDNTTESNRQRKSIHSPLQQKPERDTSNCSDMKHLDFEFFELLPSSVNSFNASCHEFGEKLVNSNVYKSKDRSMGDVQTERENDEEETRVNAVKQIECVERALELLSESLNVNTKLDNYQDSDVSEDGLNNCVSQNYIDDIPYVDKEYYEQRISVLQLRLDEALKTISKEREERSALRNQIDKTTSELRDAHQKCDALREAKQEALSQLIQVQSHHQDQLQSIQLDLQDETYTRESMDKRLLDLRIELEKLQSENAIEWGKRERLESEKMSLERDNKKLKAQIGDLQDRLEKKSKIYSGAGDAEVKQLQQELYDKNKDLNELKHAHGKLRKVLQDKSIELGHAVRRAEQYENEVRKLRNRVDELKKEVASAEDELDSSSNSIRKLQRTNDELQEQNESLQVQIGHLQARMRSSSSSFLSHLSAASLLKEGLSDNDVSD